MEATYTFIERGTPSSRACPLPNVGSAERLLMLLAGAALLGYAWKNGSKKPGPDVRRPR